MTQGFKQISSIDFTETYAPTTLIPSIRVELIKACAQGWEIHQMDVKTTFLNGELNEEIYMTLPKMNKEEPTQTCRLKKSLYGLRQTGGCWYISASIVSFYKIILHVSNRIKASMFFVTMKNILLLWYMLMI